MAKPNVLPETATTVVPQSGEMTFRDKVYTSRTLILPDDSTRAVTKGRVTVTAIDVQALGYLQSNGEFEPYPE